MAEQAGRLYIWCGGDTVHRCSPAFARCSDFLRTVYDSDERNLFVANADMPLFCAAALPVIEENLHLSAPSELSAWRPVECKLAFFLDKNGKNVIIGAQATYGPRRFTLCGTVPAEHKDGKSASGPSPLRDVHAEGKAKTLVESVFRSRSNAHPHEQRGSGCQPYLHRLGPAARSRRGVYHAGVRPPDQRRQAAPEHGRFAVWQPDQPYRRRRRPWPR